MDLNNIFGHYPPVPYFMQHNSMYSESFLVVKFGEGFLTDLTLLRDFFTISSSLDNDVEVILGPGGEDDAPDGVLPQYHSSNSLWGTSKDYHSFSMSMSDALDYVESPRESPWEVNILVNGDDFILGCISSWVIVYFSDAERAGILRALAGIHYEYAYSAVNQHGNVTISREEKDLHSSFLSKAEPNTVIKGSFSDKPMYWDRFALAGIDPINYNIRQLENHVRFHIPIEAAGAEVRRIFDVMEISDDAVMVYHGAIAQTLDSNCLISEEVYRDADGADAGVTLQSFVREPCDVPAYLEENHELIEKDCTVFFGDGFVFGSYDRGTDFAFFDVALKAKFEDALLALGYVPEESWWEKSEEG